MSVPKKKSVVSRKVSDQQVKDALRWNAFLHASGLPYNQLTPTWWDVFDAQSDPITASVVLVELVDIAIAQDGGN